MGFMYTQLPRATVAQTTDITSMRRISPTQYRVEGSGTHNLTFENIDDASDVRNENNIALPYTATLPKNARYKVTDGSIWTTAKGIYLNGVDAYLECPDISEFFLRPFNSSMRRYRKLQYTPLPHLDSRPRPVLFTHQKEFARNVHADVCTDINADGYRLTYFGSEYAKSNKLLINTNKIEVDGKFYVDNQGSGNYESIAGSMDNTVESNTAKFTIGRHLDQSNNQYGYWHARIWNIELGENVWQINPNGDVINQNGDVFLKLRGGAIWDAV